VSFEVQGEAAALDAMMNRYTDVPMSLADACLVPYPNCATMRECSRWTAISAGIDGLAGSLFR
jgi:hypothetical protein